MKAQDRAATEAGATRGLLSHLDLASLETRRLVGGPAAVADQRAVVLWHELGYDGPAGEGLLPIA